MLDLAPPPDRISGLLETFLGGRLGRTRAQYEDSLRRFALWLGVAGPAEAMRALLSLEGGGMNQKVLDYRNGLLAAGLAPRTINSRIAAIRSAVKLARLVGLTSYLCEVPDVKSKPTRRGGLSRSDFLRMVDAEPSLRNKAMLRLSGDRALRSEEVVRLDREDWADKPDGTARAAVLGKGDREKDTLTVARETADVVRAYLAERGDVPGPLFMSKDGLGTGKRGGKRLDTSMIRRILAVASARIGADFAPHDLRRMAVTCALDRTNGDVRKVQKFARHRNVTSTLIYDDYRKDYATDVAKMVASTPTMPSSVDV